MITIEHLEVMFDAVEQRDEVVFARLFTRHMEGWERRHEREQQQQAQARRERSLDARHGGRVG